MSDVLVTHDVPGGVAWSALVRARRELRLTTLGDGANCSTLLYAAYDPVDRLNIPDTLKTVAFIEKDNKRFPSTHGWAFAQWAYDAATDTFKPSELAPSGAECGFACHTKVSAQDYIFTAYPKR